MTGQFRVRVYRKDSEEDHAHKLHNGKYTRGMNMKPDGRHAHLYELDNGDMMETSGAPTGVAHDHESVFGPTGQALPVRKDALAAAEERYNATATEEEGGKAKFA
jgi:hypothetical protein